MTWTKRVELALAGALLAGLAGAPRAEPRVEVLPWADSVVSPPFAGTDDVRSLQAHLPDTLAMDARPELHTPFVDDVPVLDGDLADWPVVRWRDARGSSMRVRGAQSGPTDATLRFALLWSVEGLVLGVEVTDDSLTARPAGSGERIDSVLLYVGSASSLVTRYWRGPERAFRVWADGRLEAWTRQHNRRPVLFDAGLLGVRGAATTHASGTVGGRIVAELFVPWKALFPALPHAGAALLANVLFEDLDGTAAKLFAWSTQAGEHARQQRWARLAFRGGPAVGTRMTSVGASHVEPGQPHDLSLLRWSGAPGSTAAESGAATGHAGVVEATLRVRSADAGEHSTPLRLEGDAHIVRIVDLPEARLPWRRSRRIEIDLGSEGATWFRQTLHSIPTAASMTAGLEELATLRSESSGFPRREDVAIRMRTAAERIAELHDWFTVRHMPMGVLAGRAAFWLAFESHLTEAELLRDVFAGDGDAADVQRGLDERWPRRQADGHPIGQPILRGHRSRLDDSVQPFVMHVPTRPAGSTAPLLVVLHAFGEDAWQPFVGADLTRQAERRGWYVAAPYGRGDTGFVLAGERDVLQVIETVREQFPIDATRIYLTGYGMGGTGTWLLSLRHAELFAAASIVSGYGDMDQPGLFQALAYHPEELFFYETQNPSRLVRPKLNTAYRIVHAERDPLISVVHARIMEDRLREFGVRNELVIHASDLHGRALFLDSLDGDLTWMAAHQRASPGVVNAQWFGGIGGPVATVFARGPFSVVYGTHELPADSPVVGGEARGGMSLTGPKADARTAQQFAEEWESLFSGTPSLVSDSDTLAFEDGRNLVVVGDPRTNRLLREADGQLPVIYDGDHFEIAGRRYHFGDAGVVYATASPLQPGTTWVVISGMGERLGGFQKSILKLGADYIVTNDRREMLVVGHFRGLGGVRPQLERPDGAPR